MANKGLHKVLAVSFSGMSDAACKEAWRNLLCTLQVYDGPRGPWSRVIPQFLDRNPGLTWLFFKPGYVISQSVSGSPSRFFPSWEYIECTPQEVLDILVGYNKF
jgi:hypothetical protein